MWELRKFRPHRSAPQLFPSSAGLVLLLFAAKQPVSCRTIVQALPQNENVTPIFIYRPWPSSDQD